MSTDRIIESAREVAGFWNACDDWAKKTLREQISVDLGDRLDELVRRCSVTKAHRPFAFKQTVRGRAENGWQPETEHFWTCACRDGKSGDMGGSGWAKQAADKHRANPTQFPGWLE